MAVRAELTEAIAQLPMPFVIGAPDLPAIAPPARSAMLAAEAHALYAAAIARAGVGTAIEVLDNGAWRSGTIDRVSTLSTGRFHVALGTGGAQAWVTLPSDDARLRDARGRPPTTALRQQEAAQNFAERAAALAEEEAQAAAANSVALKRLIETVERHRRVCASPRAHALLRSAMLLAALRKSVRAANYDQVSAAR